MDDSTFRWWQRGIVYQVYPRSFKDSNGDGIGDLQGIIDKLDYLNDGTPNSLGIDAIWISPFYKSPMADFGYDVADYCDIDPMFGDLETFDRLVEEAHKRSIKVIIDWVPNHTSDQHEWFIESRSSRDNPKRNWYIWRDAKPDGSPPNNWGSIFGGPAWEWDEKTQQYYYHMFVKEQPDLNWANPEVVEAMSDVLHFWLKRGVDGFRMDVVYLLHKAEGLPDNPLNPDADPTLPENDIFSRQLHTYDGPQPEVHNFTRRFRQITDMYEDRTIVGEVWEDDLAKWTAYYGPEGDAIQLPFNFRLMQLPVWSATSVRTSVDELEAALPEFAWPNYVIGNHDRPRPATRVGGQGQARVAQMLLLTLRGTPTMYQGDELGMEEAVIPREKMVDPKGINLGVTRDGCRTPMQWDGSEWAGFSTAEPWLPVQDDYMWRNVQTMSPDPRSFLSMVRRLVWLRRETPALNVGSYTPLDGMPAGVYAYVRQHGNQRILVALNFTGESKTLEAPGTGRVLLNTLLDHDGGPTSSTLNLRGDEGIIIALD
jgi:alpha-glucosidase